MRARQRELDSTEGVISPSSLQHVDIVQANPTGHGSLVLSAGSVVIGEERSSRGAFIVPTSRFLGSRPPHRPVLTTSDFHGLLLGLSLLELTGTGDSSRAKVDLRGSAASPRVDGQGEKTISSCLSEYDRNKLRGNGEAMKRGKKLAVNFMIGAKLHEHEKQGLLVEEMVKYAPAATNGLRSGDVIVSRGRQALNSLSTFRLSLRGRNTILVRRGRHSKHLNLPAVNFASLRGCSLLLLGIDGGEFKGKIKLGSTCTDGDCTEGSIWSYCQTYYTVEGEGPHGGVMLLRHCSSTNLDTKNTHESADPSGPKEYF
jgi:hypothetical protein